MIFLRIFVFIVAPAGLEINGSGTPVVKYINFLCFYIKHLRFSGEIDKMEKTALEVEQK